MTVRARWKFTTIMQKELLVFAFSNIFQDQPLIVFYLLFLNDQKLSRLSCKGSNTFKQSAHSQRISSACITATKEPVGLTRENGKGLMVLLLCLGVLENPCHGMLMLSSLQQTLMFTRWLRKLRFQLTWQQSRRATSIQFISQSPLFQPMAVNSSAIVILNLLGCRISSFNGKEREGLKKMHFYHHAAFQRNSFGHLVCSR